MRRYRAAGHQLDYRDGGHGQDECRKRSEGHTAPTKAPEPFVHDRRVPIDTGSRSCGALVLTRPINAPLASRRDRMDVGAHPAQRVRVERRGHGGDHTHNGGSGNGPGHTEERGDDRTRQGREGTGQDLNEAYVWAWPVSWRRRVRHRFLIEDFTFKSQRSTLLGSSAIHHSCRWGASVAVRRASVKAYNPLGPGGGTTRDPDERAELGIGALVLFRRLDRPRWNDADIGAGAREGTFGLSYRPVGPFASRTSTCTTCSTRA